MYDRERTRREVAEGLLAIKAVFLRPEDPFTWASGIKSPVYCDNRLILTAPEIRTMVEKHMADTIKETFPEVEVLMGTATAGIAHAGKIPRDRYDFRKKDLYPYGLSTGPAEERRGRSPFLSHTSPRFMTRQRLSGGRMTRGLRLLPARTTPFSLPRRFRCAQTPIFSGSPVLRVRPPRSAPVSPARPPRPRSPP